MVAKPPLGLLYIASSLRAQGFVPEVLDAQHEEATPEAIRARIDRLAPLFVGFTANTISEPAVCHAIRSIRRSFSRLAIVVGGPGTTQPAAYLDAGANFIVLGEGERTAVALAEALLKAGGNARQVAPPAGSIALQDDQVVHGEPAPRIDDLDALPFPAWDLVPVDRYLDAQVPGMRRPYFPVVTSRVCRFRCSFC